MNRDGARSETFGFICRRCSRCCHHQRIQINPYEVARLAKNFGQTTTEFRANWTKDGAGTTLQQTDTGACVFLGPEGCTVHADRPLVCRLYPLGRHVRSGGSEYFSRIDPHPLSEGEFTDKGTIKQFLEQQQAAPFLQAADEYFAWLCAAQHHFIEAADAGASDGDAGEESAAVELLDMDLTLARHCSTASLREPAEIEDRKRLHLAILNDHANGRVTDANE